MFTLLTVPPPRFFSHLTTTVLPNVDTVDFVASVNEALWAMAGRRRTIGDAGE